ncbi:MAG: HAMP domain-containing histidine kinase [Ignavibacteria bacterium]|nr:HAMP domain-containing histidine kinase [Ignavibacteria bacterium]
MLGKLSASLTHEIRNPLSAIRLNLDYMGMWADDVNPEIKESIDSCKEAVNRISHLIESMLEFSRKATSEQTLNNINEIIDMGVAIMAPAVQLKSIHLQVELAPGIPLVRFNKNKMLQVIINLITNAMEACSKAGVISIQSGFDHENVHIQVKDNGCGISETNQPKIFTDFYTNKNTGTGLGLSVCRSIIEEHDGEISFSSREGHGTTFNVCIPIQKNASE